MRAQDRGARIALAFMVALAAPCVGARAETAAEPASPPGAVQSEQRHDREFWLALARSDYAVPAGESVERLAEEAVTLLADRDPVMRDEVAYSALAAWAYRDARLEPASLERLRKSLSNMAAHGLGRTGDDTIFGRSFAVLTLAAFAATDLKRPWLDAAGYDELVAVACRSLREERDLRGYVPERGWAHGAAHAADLVKFLVRSPRMTPAHARQVVACVRTRLQTIDAAFLYGEDARLAIALATLLRRSDADPEPVQRWCIELIAAHRAFWAGAFDPVRFVRLHAEEATLALLQAELDTDAGDASPAVRDSLRNVRRAVR